MIPSANSTGDLSWHAAAAADNWADHPTAVAAVGAAYPSATSVGTDPRYLNLHRHQVLDWENAMLLAHHDTVYDQQVDDYSKPANMPASMHAEPISSLSHPRHYENLLSVHMNASTSNSLGSHNAWGLLNTVCSRGSSSAGQLPHHEAASTFLQTASGPYSYDSCLHHEGAEGLVGYGSLAAAGSSLYADSLRSGSSAGGNMLGLSGFDQRRLDDIVKRELYTTHDFNSRLGLNLGGRTYFSAADDFAFGRWGKRLRPNSPGCLMQPAPLCQAEGCKADLSMAKHYHRRHKVCEYHSKAATVHIGEQTQRFCQQCSRFHALAEFDDGKRSCRKRLADHNRRRRKPQPTPALAIESSADAKDQSQEVTARNENLQNGTESSKGSPMQLQADDQAAASLPTLSSSTANANEGSSSSKGPSLQAALDPCKKPIEQALIKAGVSSSTSPSQLKSSASSAGAVPARSKSSTTTSEVAETTQLAASLSLGATDLLDVKPAVASAPSSAGPASHEAPLGSLFESAASASKHAVIMPWMQEPRKHQTVQGFQYGSTSKSDHSLDGMQAVGVNPAVQYGEKGGGADSQGRSWMMKAGMAAHGGVSQLEKDQSGLIMSMSSRQAGRSSTEGGTGHEFLRLLGDDQRELLSSHKQSTTSAAALQMNPTSLGTLAFLDHSSHEPPGSVGFLRDTEQHRMIQLSSLRQQRAADDQLQVQDHSHQLHLASSNFIFGHHNHNHML